MNLNFLIQNLKSFRKIEEENRQEDIEDFKDALFDRFCEDLEDDDISDNRDDFFHAIEGRGVNFSKIKLPDRDSRANYFEELYKYDLHLNQSGVGEIIPEEEFFAPFQEGEDRPNPVFRPLGGVAVFAEERRLQIKPMEVRALDDQQRDRDVRL